MKKLICFIACVVLCLPAAASAVLLPFINEIHYDNEGTDIGEGVELAGPSGLDFSGWRLYLYNGSDFKAYNNRLLSGVIPDLQNGFGVLSFFYASVVLQNGPADGLALVNPSNAVIQFLSYEGSLTALDGPAAGMRSTDIGVSENSAPINYSLQLVGRGESYSDFTWQNPEPNTFGEVNSRQTFATTATIISEPCTLLLLGLGTLLKKFLTK